ncbi:MAG: hypothetical protein GX813_02505 [Erysipelotrichia bacterium]|nr:hypothetical protein [Erysipelotrichia bacterium]
MPSATSGKDIVIRNIRVAKKHIILTFFNREKIQISKEAYLADYLYKGKTISETEIKKLLAITASSTLLSYALALLSKKPYTEAEIVEKLKKKGSDEQSTALIIAKIKSSNLINDKLFTQNLVAYDSGRNYGKNKIIRRLKNRGIKEEILNTLVFPLEDEQKKAEQLLPKLVNRYVSLAFKNQKRRVYQALIAHGFSHEIARQVSNCLKSDSKETERAKLLKDYQILEKRYARKYNGYELRQRIFRFLVNKGYEYQDIKKVMEDITNENDC